MSDLWTGVMDTTDEELRLAVAVLLIRYLCGGDLDALRGQRGWGLVGSQTQSREIVR